MLNPPIWYAIAGVFGLIIGSFLNVVIVRLPRIMEAQWRRAAADIAETPYPDDPDNQLSLAWPPSTCPNCEVRLKAWHNIPVVSFLALRGRCHNCREPISWHYPAVELLTAVIALLSVWQFGPTPEALGATVFGWLLIPTALIDLKTQLLLDNLTLTVLWIGLLASLWHFAYVTPVSPTMAVAGAIIGYAVIWVIERVFYWITRQHGLGQGDIKLVAAIGAWVGATHLIIVVLLASSMGLLTSGVLFASGLREQARCIAFGPWLALGGWLTLVFGPEMIGAYTSAFGFH